MNRQLPDLAELHDARDRVGDRVHRTPLVPNDQLSERSGTTARLKCENFQRTGSFKIRGAFNASLRAHENGEIRDAGLLTYSSGNHGQAVAYAAKQLGVPATIVVPEDIPALKRDAIAGHGATIEACGLTSTDRFDRAVEIETSTGAKTIHPFDHPDIIAGQAGVGFEILEDFSEVDVILAPIGGGGLISGVALAAALAAEGVEVWGVEPEDANAMQLSVEADRLVTLQKAPTTIADGLRPVAPGELTFEAVRRHVQRVVTVNDDDIRSAQNFLLQSAKMLAETSGSATTAALLKYAEELEGKKVVAIISGGNTAGLA